MKKLLRRLFLLGALAGAAYAARSYLQRHSTERHSTGQENVQIVFDEGSTRSLASNTTEGREFTDIARKIVETGL
jgi:hypothetical protein